MAYFHDIGVVHRDLKPENVLIDRELNNTLKIIDFGTSVMIEPGQILTNTHGTSYYIAPEVLKNSYNQKCDVWSVGVILFILLSGRPPFDGKNDDEITNMVKTGKYKMNDKIWEDVSQDGKKLIKSMLTYDYTQRISAREAL